MSCERARELIIDALIEPLDAERAAELREHVSRCDACAAEAATYEQLWEQLGSVATLGPRTDAPARLEAAVAAELAGEVAGQTAGPESAGTARDAPGAGSDNDGGRWVALLRKAATVIFLVGAGAALAVGFEAWRRPAEPPLAQGNRYMLIMTRTLETPEMNAQVNREMGEWIGSLREQGIVESIEGLAQGPPIEAPAAGSLLDGNIAGFLIIRARDAAEARRIAAQSPSINYGGSVEVRAIN